MQKPWRGDGFLWGCVFGVMSSIFLCMYGKTPILATKGVKSECMPINFSLFGALRTCVVAMQHLVCN